MDAIRSAFVDAILSACVSAAVEELRLRLLFSFDGDRGRLKGALTQSRILIDGAERWSFKDERLAEPLTQLKDAAYDAEDFLDDIDYQDQQKKIQAQQSQASQFLYNSRNYLRNLINGAAKKMKTIHGRLDTAGADLQGLMGQLGFCGDCSMPANRETSSLVDKSIVYGRDEEREKVIELLGVPRGQSNNENDSVSVSAPAKTREKENVSVLSICGIGGVGKTTLAQVVYNDERVVKHFDLKIWIHVSDNFNVNSLSKEIIDKAGKGCETDGMYLDSLQETLKEIVMAHRFLLILDDVWNENEMEWRKFYAPLSYGKEGSMILVTTRTLTVANIAGTVDPILLEGLSGDAYWEFFKSCAFRLKNPKDYPELEKIGRGMAAKLKGSPLAAKTLGSLLNEGMDAGHWTTILNSELWELPQKKGDIIPALRLSYLYLPPHLKRCFSFCSIFPKDYEFDKSDLTSIWIAEGFVIPQEPQGNMLLEDIATMYLRDLTSRCFLQQSHRDPLNYVMHDLIHDLAQFVSANECSRIDQGRGQIRIPKTVRHLSICCTILEEKKLMELEIYDKLSSIIIFSKFRHGLDSVIDCWFRRLANIRCLKLNFCEITKLPKSVSNLKHLRYLDVSRTSIKSLPNSLCHLNNLQVLNVTNCLLECFPQGFTRLHNLRKLYPKEAVISNISEIGKLTSLQYLPQFEVRKDDQHKIGELNHMTQLRECLHIRQLENVESKEDACQAELDNKPHLDELILEWSLRESNFHHDTEVLEGLQPHKKLKKLNIQHYGGTTSPSWLGIQTLTCLSELRIEKCSSLTELPSLPLSLTSLVLHNVGLKSLPRLWDESQDSTNKSKTQQGGDNSSSSSIRSSSLRKLHISGCFKLTSLLGLQRLTCLSELCIEECSGLTELPSLPLSLASLVLDNVGLKSFLGLWDECQDSTNESKTQQGSDNSSSSRSNRSSLLRYLYISLCPELTSLEGWPMPHYLPSLEAFTVTGCENLTLLLTDSFKDCVSLKSMKIEDCPLVTSLPEQVMCQLKSLESLYIVECEELSSLGGLGALASLKDITIRHCPKLADSEPPMSDFTNEVRRTEICLSIDRTTLLKLQSLTNLVPFIRELEIFGSSEPEMFVGEDRELLQWFKSLKHLRFMFCKELNSLSTELHRLTSLQKLSIRNCSQIHFLPENGLPASLTELDFHGCNEKFTQQLEMYKSLKNLNQEEFHVFSASAGTSQTTTSFKLRCFLFFFFFLFLRKKRRRDLAQFLSFPTCAKHCLNYSI